MKIKSVKVYQAVTLNRKPDTYFPNKNDISATIELMPNIGVKITGKVDTIIVPFPNVAYLNIEEQEEKEAKVSAKK